MSHVSAPRSHFNMLHLYYSLPVPQEGEETELVEMGPDSHLSEKKYGAYFHRLSEEMTDLLLAQRLVAKGHVAAPMSAAQHGLEFVLALFGVAVPIAHFIKEAGHHVPHLIHLAKDSIELGHTVFEASHHHSEYKAPSDLRGQQLDVFIDQLAATLTFRLRFELLKLTEKECAGLAHWHFNLIKECLEHVGKDDVKSVEDLYVKLLDLVDPHPVQEIAITINAYVNERRERFFRSSNSHREQFLNDILASIQKEDISEVHCEELIEKISSVYFVDDWTLRLFGYGNSKTVAESDPTLSMSNPFIKKLKGYRGEAPSLPPSNANQKPLIFNNAFWTASFKNHIPMSRVCQEIVLNLFRCMTIQVMQDNQEMNEDTVRIIDELASPESKLRNRKITSLSTQIEVLESRVQVNTAEIDQLKDRVRALELELEAMRHQPKRDTEPLPDTIGLE